MIFKRISIANALSRQGQDGHRRCISPERLLLEASELQVPPIAFGIKDPSRLRLKEADYSTWPERTVSLPEVYQYQIQDAVVHPPFGIITIDNWVLEETLAHIPFHFPGYGHSGDEVLLPDAEIGEVLDTALHVVAGNHTNYYHWLLDILPKAQVEPLAPYHFDGAIVVAPILTFFQQDILTHLMRPGRSVTILNEIHAVRVKSLHFVPNLANHGYAPNPGLATFFDQVKQVLRIESLSQLRLYITRRDSRNRVLQNESEVITLVKRHGFQEVMLSGADFSTQAKLFASASHIIAPHGAGLANVVFCDAHVSVCELQSEAYLNWCFRRLVGVRGGRYGCVVGPACSETHPSPPEVQWSIPLDQLEMVLNDPEFIAPATTPPSVTNE